MALSKMLRTRSNLLMAVDPKLADPKLADPKLAETSRFSVPAWQQVLAPHGLGYRIRLLSQLMGRSLQQKLEPYGLTPFHWVVLCCLWEQDGLATSDIASRLQQVGGTMTGVINRMEERGLVYRAQDECDRRIWRIWLSEAGWQLQHKLPPIVTEVRQQTLKGLSEQEQQQFSELVDRAIASLSE